jgi:hypothetical protein
MMMIRSITERPAGLTLKMMSSFSNVVVSRRSLSGGAGMGNVENKILPSTFAENKLFKHCKYPRTASIIGYVY